MIFTRAKRTVKKTMLETIAIIVAISGVIINVFLMLAIFKVFRLYEELLDVQAERFDNLTKLCIDLVNETITRVTGKDGENNA